MNAAEREMIRWGRLLFERRLVSGWGGNLSRRLGRREFLITAQHAPLGFLTPRDLVRIDETGKTRAKNRRASSETPMHLAVYQGCGAQAVVHAHPPAVVAFSLARSHFIPASFEEKYTIGRVPVIPQETPTVTEPEALVEALKYGPIAILKGHGTVAAARSLEEAFLYTDLLEEAVRCQFFNERLNGTEPSAGAEAEPPASAGPAHALFSRAHMEALVATANSDPEFRAEGERTDLTTSLTLRLDDTAAAWTVDFAHGEIRGLRERSDGEFLIGGKAEWWRAVFCGRIDPFLATQQGKLELRRGELARLSRWYKPFQRAFALWRRIPIE
ncbi:MAG TPA: class II aldolase/adducin family protein [candidate division Zixibacteria bacterium]|nr:class II aldolase/adducin family protein [candidate division Zixibacteria bacterium]